MGAQLSAQRGEQSFSHNPHQGLFCRACSVGYSPKPPMLTKLREHLARPENVYTRIGISGLIIGLGLCLGIAGMKFTEQDVAVPQSGTTSPVSVPEAVQVNAQSLKRLRHVKHLPENDFKDDIHTRRARQPEEKLAAHKPKNLRVPLSPGIKILARKPKQAASAGRPEGPVPHRASQASHRMPNGRLMEGASHKEAMQRMAKEYGYKKQPLPENLLQGAGD